jgi:uncharacterized protein YyaL (SSP411 family)
MMAIALEEHLAGAKTVVLRGSGEGLSAWRRDLARHAGSDTLVVAIPDGVAGLPAPLDKPPRPGEVNAWVCRGVSCLEPIGDLSHLKKVLKESE